MPKNTSPVAEVEGPTATPLKHLQDALRASGRRMDWLARKTRYSVWHVSKVVNGHVPASEQFQRLAAEALDLPESYLFPGAGKQARS